jgi:hypothetical protein
MTRAPRTHGPTVEGIEASLAIGASVSLNCIVERQNYQQLGAHAKQVVDLFAEPFPDNPIAQVSYSHPCSYFDPADWEKALVPLDEQKEHLIEAVDVLNKAGIPVDCIGTCGFPPCLFKDHPELQRSLARDDFGHADTSGRVFGDSCSKCTMAGHCLGVRREYLEVHGEQGLEPFETPVPGFAAMPLDAP